MEIDFTEITVKLMQDYTAKYLQENAELVQNTIKATQEALCNVGVSFSYFEDNEGNKYHLNGHDCDKGEIQFMFSNGKLIWFIFTESGFDIPLKLISK